jgi:two-component system LytT family response regulator
MKKLILSAVIIDDEISAIEVLADMLKAIPSIKIVATASNLNEGVEQIKRTQPDIVFLDINMPQRNGLEIYKEFNTPSFKIIFCTAYDQYAINALGKSASGYLLKPVDLGELKNLIQKVSDEFLNENNLLQIEETVNVLSMPDFAGENILLDVEHGFIMENSRNIVYCYAQKSYAVVVLNTQKEFTVPKSLKELQAILPENQFYRTHKSYLVNIYYIQEFIRGNDNYVLLEDGIKIPVSIRVTSVIAKEIKKKLTV